MVVANAGKGWIEDHEVGSCEAIVSVCSAFGGGIAVWSAVVELTVGRIARDIYVESIYSYSTSRRRRKVQVARYWVHDGCHSECFTIVDVKRRRMKLWVGEF